MPGTSNVAAKTAAVASVCCLLRAICSGNSLRPRYEYIERGKERERERERDTMPLHSTHVFLKPKQRSGPKLVPTDAAQEVMLFQGTDVLDAFVGLVNCQTCVWTVFPKRSPPDQCLGAGSAWKEQEMSRLTSVGHMPKGSHNSLKGRVSA